MFNSLILLYFSDNKNNKSNTLSIIFDLKLILNSIEL